MTPTFSIQKIKRGTSGGWPHAWLCGSNRHLLKQVKFLSLPGNYMNLVALVGNPTLGDKQRETQSPLPLFELRSLQTPTTSTGHWQTSQCVSATASMAGAASSPSMRALLASSQATLQPPQWEAGDIYPKTRKRSAGNLNTCPKATPTEQQVRHPTWKINICFCPIRGLSGKVLLQWPLSEWMNQCLQAFVQKVEL